MQLGTFTFKSWKTRFDLTRLDWYVRKKPGFLVQYSKKCVNMTCFGEMCLQEISTVGVCWQSAHPKVARFQTSLACNLANPKDVLVRENWRCAWRRDILLVIAPHTPLSHYLPKYQITQNIRIVSEQPIYNITWSFVNSHQ